MRRKVYFRADAGRETGYGHFIRSLALADMLKDDFECTFFTCSPTEYQVREVSRVCPLVALPSEDHALRPFLDMLDGDEIVVLDNYFFDREYQESVRSKGCVLVCIDDIHTRTFAADMVISPFVTDPGLYRLAARDAFLAIGLRHSPLRHPFLSPLPSKSRRFEWLVCFGGSDPCGLTERYSEAVCSAYPGASVAVVAGDGCVRRSFPEGVSVYESLDATQMAALMSDSRKVLCPVSTVCCEALACGCEVYAGYYVDNQEDAYKTFTAGEYIHPLGDLRLGGTFDPDDGAGLKKLSFSGVRDTFRSLFRALSLQIINYTDLTRDMSRKVWEARNEESVRRCMTNPAPFGFDSHCAFVDGLRGDCSRLYFAFFDGDNFVGSYDFTGIIDGESAERGLYVAAPYRRMGIASAMESVMECLIVRRGVRRLRAEVLKSNGNSISFHRAAGYEVLGEDDEYVYMVRDIL
ncbi:MAG: GNAT family N-acetyltransferase [Bacteroidales bacterium]|nr:GNAT family N-acetyltransferase [Bacteroidales bacterium]